MRRRPARVVAAILSVAVSTHLVLSFKGPSLCAAMPTTYGFVGVGTMNQRIVQGLCACSKPPQKLVVSPRNAEKAAALQQEFPSIVSVSGSNQEVVDASDVVFLGVLPAQMAEVIATLKFREEQLLVSLASTVPLDVLRSGCMPVPAERIVRAIPLPPVAKQRGVTLITPPQEDVISLFNLLGTAVAVSDEAQMKSMMGMTTLMGQFYEQQLQAQRWLEGQGVDSEIAAKYIGSLFHCFSFDSAEATADTFAHLVAEQTPGGLNEMVVRQLREAGAYTALNDSLDAVASRIRGQPMPELRKTPYSSEPAKL